MAAVDQAHRDLGTSWSGLSAQAALRNVTSISDRVANDATSERDALLTELRTLDPSDPAAPERQTSIVTRLAEITNVMIDLATHRGAADDDAVQRVRAAVATTSDLPPDEYPSERDWLSDATYDYSIDDPLGYSTDESYG